MTYYLLLLFDVISGKDLLFTGGGDLLQEVGGRFALGAAEAQQPEEGTRFADRPMIDNVA